jgi:hypothetical protein
MKFSVTVFVSERLALLRDAERRFDARRVADVLEVDEDALCGFGAEVDRGAGVFDRPHERFEHEVELPRFGQFAFALAGALAPFLRALRLGEFVGAEARLAHFAIDHRVVESPATCPDVIHTCPGA